MMNRCAYQSNGMVSGAFGERRRSDSISICVPDGVVCPKPRRFGHKNHPAAVNDHIRPSRWHANYQAEVYDTRAGTDLLDMILMKGSYGGLEKPNTPIPSSPPFFTGSPPCRASNPIVKNVEFTNENPSRPLAPESALSSSSTLKSGGGGCVRKFGPAPAVRVEGFCCGGDCGISAVA